MPRDRTLQRARTDLASGDARAAVRRLRGLVGALPADLAARDLLADAYRRLGDAVQAGRWSYLGQDRDPAEVAAFERQTRDPVDRMRALAWRDDAQVAATPVARERLARLLEEAQAATGDASLTYASLADRRWRPDVRPATRLGSVLAAVVVTLLVLLLLVGITDGFLVVLGWLRHLLGVTMTR